VEPQVADCNDLEIGTLVRWVGTNQMPVSDIGVVTKIPAEQWEYIHIIWIKDGLCHHNITGLDDAFYHGHMEIASENR